MSITTKCALGIAAALFVFGSACSDSKQEKAGTAASQTGAAQTTQPAPNVDARQLAQEPLVTNLSES
ncbi:MAG TPA: hypothetical protein VF180_03650, partial [Acidimicrobiia bacterium]